MKRTALTLAFGPLLSLTSTLAQDTPAPAEKEQPPQKQEQPAGADEAAPGEAYRKSNKEVLELYAPVVAEARMSTAQVLTKNWRQRLALAVVVSPNGYLLTKASEVEKSKSLEVAFAKSPTFPEGLKMGATVVDLYKPFDLALLKVDASGLRPIKWAASVHPGPGSLLAAPGLAETPVAIGVASVEPRSLDEENKGFLGVGLQQTENGLTIMRITANSAAAEAGLILNDIVLQVNGKSVASRDDFVRTVAGCKPKQKIILRIKRGEDEKDIEATLRRRGDFPEAVRRFEDPRNAMSGPLSKTRSGFPAALQHDLFLQPFECGGPLVDLDGEVVGVNIARSGRIESLAIPSAVLQELLKEVEQGRFFRPELEELKKSREKTEEELKRIQDMEAKFRKELEDIDKRLNEVLGKPAPPSGKPAPPPNKP